MADRISQIGTGIPIAYDERDFFGAEEPAGTITDFTGFNEFARWTRDVETDLAVEHFRTGVHNTLKIHRALIWLRYISTSTSYAVARAYAQSTTGDAERGTDAVAALTRNGTGDVTVKLAYPLAGTNVRLFCLTPGFYEFNGPTAGAFGGSVVSYARTWLWTVSASDTFRVVRKSWTLTAGAVSGAALTDGDMVFGVVHA